MGLTNLAKIALHKQTCQEVVFLVRTQCKLQEPLCVEQLSSFMAPKLWFMDLTVATCHIRYIFLSLCQFFSRLKRPKHVNTRSPPFLSAILLSAQSTNIERQEKCASIFIRPCCKSFLYSVISSTLNVSAARKAVARTSWSYEYTAQRAFRAAAVHVLQTKRMKH